MLFRLGRRWECANQLYHYNIQYETRCSECQERELDEIENKNLSEHEKRELKNKVKLFKYIRDTIRSTFERGWEHRNDLTTLS